jgi:hypothetical protein
MQCKHAGKVKIWYWTTKRNVFELNGRLFDGWNALRRDAGFRKRNTCGWVLYRGWEDDADILMRNKSGKKGTTKGGAEYPSVGG